MTVTPPPSSRDKSFLSAEVEHEDSGRAVFAMHARNEERRERLRLLSPTPLSMARDLHGKPQGSTVTVPLALVEELLGIDGNY
jgi:hypothetical protein